MALKLRSLRKFVAKFPQNRKKYYDKTVVFTKRKPFSSFLILFLAIVGNNLLTPKPPSTQITVQPKVVSVYRIGTAPRATFSARVNKKGVIQIVALTPGIVSEINVSDGQSVTRGTNLINLSNNYQGGNAASVQQQIAYDQYKNNQDTFNTQKDIINKQKSIADQSLTSSDQLRNITNQSISDTQSLMDLNGTILATLNSSVENLKSTNAGGVNDAAILALEGQIAQAQAGQNQLTSMQRQSRFSADSSNPPAQIATLQHDLTIDQLNIQDKALSLGLEMSRLQLALAQIMASAMSPSAPFDGVVEKVHVSVGQNVNPGTVLVTLSSNNKNATAEVKLPADTASKISKLEDSTFFIGNKKISIAPEFVTTEATDGILNSVIYTLPENLYGQLTNGQYLKVEIPIGYADTISTIPYLPIDVVFQTQDGAFVYLAKNNKVVSRKVELGDVVGGNVAINSGLLRNDEVILDRNVIDGESIKISN